MFTGLVEEVGRIRQVNTRKGNRFLEIEAGFAGEVKVGDSIAVDGCCLSVTATDKGRFTVEAVATTAKQTTLAGLRAGSKVNLERALAMGDRLGGHVVQGHVDEVGTVRRVERGTGQWVFTVRVGREHLGLLVPKGSVCVSGVSLTIAELLSDGFKVNIIPQTWSSTALSGYRAGDKVNIEHDFTVKAIHRYLETRQHR